MRTAARARELAVAVLGGLLLTSCASPGPAPDATAARADGPASGTVVSRAVPQSVSSLPLRDHLGRPFTLESLHGKVVVLGDFLTTCQEVCPMTSVTLRDVADAARRAGLGSQVEVLEVTVDPERDTPPRLAAYQRLFGARENWRFATGRPADVARLWQFFGVAYGRTPDHPPYPRDWLTGEPLTYAVMHQDVVFVIDRQGRERWLTVGPAATGGAQPPPTLRAFLNDEGRTNLASPGAASWTARDVEAAVAWAGGEKIG